MAPGYKISLYGNQYLTSEALYQACRFPDYPEIQKQIINQHSPMYAKDISKKYLSFTRKNWNEDRIAIMRWAIRIKLLNNWYSFGNLLKSTCDKVIVEHSTKDDFWGAFRQGNEYVGVNALGRLLMQLREDYLKLETKALISIAPPNIDNFRLLGTEVGTLKFNISEQLLGENEQLW